MSSQAVWLVLSGLSFAFRSFGIAYNEVVNALLDEPHSIGNHRRFCAWLAIGTSIAILLFTVTPLSKFWIGSIMALPSDLANMAQLGLLFILLLPALSAIQSWYQGVLTNGRRTRGITEAVIIYLAVLTLGLGSGITWGRTTGLFVGLSALVESFALQTA